MKLIAALAFFTAAFAVAQANYAWYSGSNWYYTPYLWGTHHYQVVTVWEKGAGDARCDFDSILTYPADALLCNNCHVDIQYTECVESGGHCFDDWSSWPWTEAGLANVGWSNLGGQLHQDDACGGTQGNFGIEVINIMEPGQGHYAHMVYANKNAGDFTGSHARVVLYRLNGNTWQPEVVGEALIDNIGTWNGDHRFWHTIEFDIDTVAETVTVTNNNQVTCDPAATFGNTNILAIEKKYDSAGLARNC